MAVLSKLVCITNIAAPYQVKFCYALAEYFDTRFWFYERRNSHANTFWETPLGDRCAIIPNVKGKARGKYHTRVHLQWLEELNPDIVMLGGFSIPANYLAFRWAKSRGKKTIVLTEMSRTPSGRKRRFGNTWKLLKKLYAGVDAIFTLTEDATTQFRDDFGFGEKVVQARYASDLDAYFEHPLRKGSSYPTLLFANRLTPNYNPEEAIQIFSAVLKTLPGARLHLNALGELRASCEQLITGLGLTDEVHFLDNIMSWDDLHAEYKRCDILLLPAKFSSGNFTIYEAMASGMGIVISDRVLGNGSRVRNEENWFRLPLDRKLFVDAIQRYIHEPQLLIEHGEKNKAWVQQFGMKETAALYHRLISALP